MTNELQTNLDNILADKNTNLLPENLRAGITCLGVEGTMKEGVNTSDADITPEDIRNGKIAYGKDGKVVGNVQTTAGFAGKDIDEIITLTGAYGSKQSVSYEQGFDERPGYVGISELQETAPHMILPGCITTLSAREDLIAQVIGLTADKIKAGETILGITGTYAGESSEMPEIESLEFTGDTSFEEGTDKVKAGATLGTFTVTGGTAPYSYSFGVDTSGTASKDNNKFALSGNSLLVGSTALTYSNRPTDGVYQTRIVVTDSNSKTKTIDLEIMVTKINIPPEGTGGLD